MLTFTRVTLSGLFLAALLSAADTKLALPESLDGVMAGQSADLLAPPESLELVRQAEPAPTISITPPLSPAPNGVAPEEGAATRITTVPPEKVSRRLRTMAKAGGFLPVFVVLSRQPHREILQRHESASRLTLGILEGRYTQVQNQIPAPEAELREARKNLDGAMLETRRAAFKEIAAEIGPEQDAVEGLLLRLGGRNVHRYMAINMLAASVPASALASIEADPSVVQIAPIETHSAQLNISVPSLGAPSFWSAGYTGSGQSVAVLDSGVTTSHPAFVGKQIVSRFFLNGGSTDPCFAENPPPFSAADKQGHGTHVAGIVMSQGAPGWTSYLGVAPGISILYNLKIGYLTKTSAPCTGEANANNADVLDAFDWAVQQAPSLKVFNYSYATTTSQDDDTMSQNFDYLADTYGLTVVVSAGNTGPATSSVNTPGIAYNVLTVAAMNTQGTPDRSDDAVAGYSSRGPTLKFGRKKPDIAAPGGRFDPLPVNPVYGIYSADFASGGFVQMCGTSMAAPHIAGAAALLRSAGVQDPLALKALLLNTTDLLNWLDDQGWGYANLARTFGQRSNTIAATLPFNRVWLYKGVANGLFYSTLAWNRAGLVSGVGSCLSDLNLFLYDGSSGALLSSSASSIDNVQKAYVTSNGTVVVNVSNEGPYCRSPEAFGLAFSQAGFAAASGPTLNVSCTGPATVIPSAQFTVSCTITNTGDLPAFSVSGSLGYVGSTSSSAQGFGTITPSGFSAGSWLVTAPASIGSFSLNLAAASTSFGALYSAASTFSFNVSATANPAISLSRSQLNFSFGIGGSVPAGQSIQVTNAGGGTLNWTATSNASWLKVTPASGTAPSLLVVSVQPSGLAAGTYNGSIQLSSAGASNTPVTVFVTLIVAPPPPFLAVSPRTLAFNYTVGASLPAAQSVSITNTGGGSLSWTASASANWIGVSPPSGKAPATLSISVNPAGLSPGSYGANVQIAATGATGSPAAVVVTLVVQASPSAPTIAAVLNAASFQAGISSGTWIAIFGTNLASTTSNWSSGDIVNGKLPTRLDGVSATVDGKPAAVYFISPGQINVQVPDDNTLGPVPVQVTSPLGTATATAQMQAFSPGLFTFDGKYLAAQHADYSFVGKPGLISGVTTTPAQPGEVVILWGTGLGPSNPTTPAGELVTQAEPLANQVTVSIGGVQVNAQWAGISGAGLWQINVQVPSSLPSGDGLVVAQVGGVQTQGGAYITVQ